MPVTTGTRVMEAVHGQVDCRSAPVGYRGGEGTGERRLSSGGDAVHRDPQRMAWLPGGKVVGDAADDLVRDGSAAATVTSGRFIVDHF